MNPYTDNFEAAQARISSLENGICDDCRKKVGLPPKMKVERAEVQVRETASETKKKLRLMGLIALYSILGFAAFWGIWSIFAPVPTMTEIVWSKNIVWHLPFGISRWWDVAFAPLYSAAISSFLIFAKPWIITKYPDQKEDIAVGLGVSLIAGLGAGLGASLIAGLGAGLGAGLVAGLGAGLGAGLVAGLIWLIKKTIQAISWFVVLNKRMFKL